MLGTNITSPVIYQHGMKVTKNEERVTGLPYPRACVMPIENFSWKWYSLIRSWFAIRKSRKHKVSGRHISFAHALLFLLLLHAFSLLNWGNVLIDKHHSWHPSFATLFVTFFSARLWSLWNWPDNFFLGKLGQTDSSTPTLIAVTPKCLC